MAPSTKAIRLPWTPSELAPFESTIEVCGDAVGREMVTELILVIEGMLEVFECVESKGMEVLPVLLAVVLEE